MTGSSDTQQTPELTRGGRYALVIATSAYRDDASLRQLRSPCRDAEAMAQVLANPELGGFQVTTMINRPLQELKVSVQEFLTERKSDDTVLLYASSHGLTNAENQLFFATTDTVKSLLDATALEARWVRDRLEACRAGCQIIILDCCFSGSFLDHKGDDDLNLAGRFPVQGRGRVVLTASRAYEYSFEGNPTDGPTTEPSVFTAGLVQGVRSGDADRDGDGRISVEEAFLYASEQVRERGTPQTPQLFVHGGEGKIMLALSSRCVVGEPPTGTPFAPGWAQLDGIGSSWRIPLTGGNVTLWRNEQPDAPPPQLEGSAASGRSAAFSVDGTRVARLDTAGRLEVRGVRDNFGPILGKPRTTQVEGLSGAVKLLAVQRGVGSAVRIAVTDEVATYDVNVEWRGDRARVFRYSVSLAPSRAALLHGNLLCIVDEAGLPRQDSLWNLVTGLDDIAVLDAAQWPTGLAVAALPSSGRLLSLVLEERDGSYHRQLVPLDESVAYVVVPRALQGAASPGQVLVGSASGLRAVPFPEGAR